MKKLLILSLLLLGALALAACGGGKDQTDAVPMPTDGGDEALIQLDATDPLANYLDLGQLTPETLTASLQVLDQTSQDPNCTVTLRQVMGDAMTLYLSLAITYPDTMDLQDPRAVGEPLSEISLTTQAGQSATLRQQVRQIDGHTVSYLYAACYSKEVLTPGTVVTLSLTDTLNGTSAHTFQWTVETQGTFRYADLKDDAGTMVGTVILSPFGLSADLWDPSPLEGQEPTEALTLLDQAGSPLSVNPSATSAGTGTLHLEYRFFSPLEPDQAATVQIGPYAAQLNP